MRIILLLFLITFNISAQQWIEQNPKFDEGTVIDIKFVNEQTGFFIIGTALWKTTDGGSAYIKIDDPGFPGYSKIYLFGDTLKVFGPTVLCQSSGDYNSYSFTQLEFLDGFLPGGSFFSDPMIGYLIGWNTVFENRFKKTTDGGLTWETHNLPHFASGIYFSDSLHGVIATNDNGTWKTTDGGITWATLFAGTFNFSSLFSSKNIVVITAFTEGFNISTDYGYTWVKRAFNPNGANYILRDSFILSYVDYSDRYFMISYDNGISWQRYVCPTKVNTAMEAFNDSTFINGSERGSIYKTSDKGKHWQCLTKPAFDLNSASFVDASTGFIGGENILRTTDGGENWDIVFGKAGYFSPVYFINSTTGFAQFTEYGTLAIPVSETFVRTTNRGESWDTLHQLNNHNISEIYFKDNNNGYVVGDQIYYTTTDGGNSWDFTNQSLSGNDINFINSERGYIASSGTGYYTTDGGSNWINRSNFRGQTICFVDSLTGFLGLNWALMKTTDGGDTFFDLINHGQNDSFSELTFWGKDTGVVHFHYHEIIIQTTDGGTSWNTIFTWNDFYNFNMKFLTPNLGWVIGARGAIYKYSGITPVELLSFSATAEGKVVRLNWSTSTELNNKGFTIMRKMPSEQWREIAFIPGAGTTTEKQNYYYEDNLAIAGKYFYKLVQVDFNGSVKSEKEVEVNVAELPSDFVLYQNYPNPFNPSTKIKYGLPFESDTHIIIYNALGEVVKIITQGIEKAGIHEVNFDASGLASGVYIYSVKAASSNGKAYNAVNKMLLLK